MELPTARDVEQLFTDVADEATYGCFEYQGVSVGLHSDEAELLDRFGRYFGGYFTVTTGPRPDAVVYSSQDPAVFRLLEEWATSHGRSRSEHETEYVVDEHHRIIHRRDVDERKGRIGEACFLLSQPDRRVLVASPGTVKSRQKTVKRTLRNLMKLLLVEQGWLPLHSAAAIVNEAGVCIVGDKFAGKTSTLVNLLVRPGSRLISNDNLFLRDGGTCLDGCGFPNNAGLRVGTLAGHSGLLDRLEEATDPFHPITDAGTVREIIATTPADELRNRPEKIVLLSTELAGHLGVPIEHVAPIELFLVVRFDPSLGRPHLAPITDPRQIEADLAASFRSLSKEKLDFLQSFFDFDDSSLEADLHALLEKFASRVAVHELHQNAGTNEHSAELVGKMAQRIHQHA